MEIYTNRMVYNQCRERKLIGSVHRRRVGWGRRSMHREEVNWENQCREGKICSFEPSLVSIHI